MKTKLKLDPELLQVETFDLGRGDGIGTVRGHDTMPDQDAEAVTPCQGSCYGSCGRTCPTYGCGTCYDSCQGGDCTITCTCQASCVAGCSGVQPVTANCTADIDCTYNCEA